MDVLHLGHIKTIELASWFKISYDTFRRNAAKYYFTLEDYCLYEKVHGGIIVKTIMVERYDKNLVKKLDFIYLDNLIQHNNLISMTGMESETGNSRYQCTKSRNKMFGDKPINKDPNAQGLIGCRESVWAIKLDGNNNYRHLTQEENELFNSLIIKNYGGEPEKVKARELLLDYCVKEQKSAAEYAELLNEQNLDFYSMVILPFKRLTGNMIVIATQHEIIFVEQDGLSKNERAYREMLLNEVARLVNEVRKKNNL